jgi:hypothetical protein
MLEKQPPAMIITRASAWIGPHCLEIDLPPKFGNGPPPA